MSAYFETFVRGCCFSIVSPSIVISRSILPAEKESLTLLQFPLENGQEPITIVEVGPTTHACPNGLCEWVVFFIDSSKCDHVINYISGIVFVRKMSFI